jgi:hypothetical protein
VHPDHSPTTSPQRTHWGIWTCVGIGIAATVLGLVPWIVTGMRLPLQNLWAQPTAPEQMPVALIPFSQYTVSTVLGLVTTAWAAGGLAVRSLRGRLPHGAGPVVGAVILVLQVAATVQTAKVVAPNLTERTASTVYLAACVAVVAVAAIGGLIVFALVTARPRAAAVPGWALAALAIGSWAATFLVPSGSTPGGVRYWLLTEVVRWVPALIVGVAIGWAGVGTGGRIVAALAALIVLWVGPAVLTAVSASVGSRVLLAYPRELVETAVAVLRAALVSPAIVLPPLAVAVVVAAVGLGGRRLLHRS